MAGDHDLIVAGGGIAGLTAALTAARLGRTVLVLTGGVPGGLLLPIEQIDGVPGYAEGVPGYELCPTVQEQALEAGAVFSMAELVGLEPAGESWRVTTTEGEHAAPAVVLATGARLRELGVPGEERLRGKGVSHCASCDAPLLRDRTVGVVGGGDSALQEALTLAGSASRVVIFARGDALSGQAAYRQRVLEHPAIEVRYGTVVDEILGDGSVTGVRLRSTDGDGPSELELDAVFVYVGLQPNTEVVDGRVDLDESGRICTDGSMRTARRGLLAAGILRSGAPGRAAIAAGDGAAAAVAADRYLAQGDWSQQESEASGVASGTGG